MTTQLRGGDISLLGATYARITMRFWRKPYYIAFFGFTLLLTSLGLLANGENNNPGTIEVSAKRFAFVPDQITVKKGQPVTLVLRSQDVTHGLAIKELGIKTEIPKGKETKVSFNPPQAGTFEGKCSHFCGSGHGSMKFTVIVTE